MKRSAGYSRRLAVLVVAAAAAAAVAPAAESRGTTARRSSAAAPPSLIKPVIVERASRDLAGGRIRSGQLFITIRASEAIPRKADGVDATAQIHGLGSMVRMTKADYSSASGHCYETLPRPRILRSWKPGRTITVSLRLGNGQGDDARITKRVTVVPLQPAGSQATRRLGCSSSHL